MSDDLPEEVWKKGVEDSHFFFVLGTEVYFKSSTTFDQVLYAKDLQKKFIVALETGVKIPKGYPIPEDAITFEWTNQKELTDGTKKALEELIKQYE